MAMTKELVAESLRAISICLPPHHRTAIRVAIALVDQGSVSKFRQAVATINREDGRFQRKPRTVPNAK